MIYAFILLFYSLSGFAAQAPTPFPVFLKPGFSSILEFEEEPSRAVLGDNQSFQVEKLGRSLVLRTHVSDAGSNLFVYFKNEEPRVFILRASEDAEPTYYRKFEKQIFSKSDEKQVAPIRKSGASYPRTTRLLLSRFDPHKDYLSLDIQMTADSTSEIKPIWDSVRLSHEGRAIAPYKLWAERKDIQRDSKVKIRVIFVKPSVPRDLRGVSLLIPIHGHKEPINLVLRGGAR